MNKILCCLAALCFCSAAQAQTQTITGTVTDGATQQPLPGVSIIIKGTTQGTTSDAEGQFALQAAPGTTLKFSFIGYRSHTEITTTTTLYNIVLMPEATELEGVTVNAGYWQVSEKENTGNISRVSAADIARQPVYNPVATLQGRMPGVYVTEDSGIPGSGFDISIRGQNSLRPEANDPLYIVDGVPFTATSLLQITPGALRKPSPLSVLNPADIESIEVLKDADATAIYGSRGANGVVLISTKKGKSERTNVDFTFNRGMGEVANRMDLLNTEQYLTMRREALANDNRTPAATDYDVNGVWEEDRYTDWQDELFGGTAEFTTAQASLSGGNAHTRFLLSGNYNHQTTVFPGDMNYDKGSAYLNISHTSPNEKLTVNLSANYGVERNNLGGVNYFDMIYTLAPNAPAMYDEDGKLNWAGGSWDNPAAHLERTYQAKTYNLITQASIGYMLAKNLEVKTSIGYNTLDAREKVLNPIRSLRPTVAQVGSANFSRSNGSTWIAEPQISYKAIGGKGTLTAMVGATFQENQNEQLRVLAQGIENDALLENITAAPQNNVTAANDFSQYRYAALFGRVNYNWNEKYLINLTARRDGSSRFGPGKQFGNFGAVGAAWIFSQEKFLKDLRWLSFGKLRTSYGTTGSDQIGNYGYLDSYTGVTGSSQYEGGATLVPARLANPDYAWETNTKWEAALETGLWEDRVQVSVNHYRNQSSNQLVGLSLPGTTGFTTIQYNLNATVQNTGWEFDIRTVNISTPQFTWASAFNVSVPRNVLVSYPDLETSPHRFIYRIDEPLNVSIRYETTGVDAAAGLYQFVDLDGSGTITTADDSKAVRVGLLHHGGFQNTFSYKGWQAEIFFQYVKKTSNSYRGRFTVPGQMGNQPVEVMDRWQQAADETTIQKFTSRSGAPATAHTRWMDSDGAIDDASFIRLKNVSLSWQLPAGWITPIRLQSARVFVQGRNLITFTKFKGLDPEGHLGLLRMYTVGIQLGL
jgi:TonB-dependent starch-binding outer membrane protein SusC